MSPDDHDLRIQIAVLQTKMESLENRLEGVRVTLGGQIDEVKGIASKIAWMVIGAVVVAVIGFVLKGGLVIPGPV